MLFLYIPVAGSSSDLPWSLLHMNESVTVYDSYVFDPLNPCKEAFEALAQYLAAHNFDCLISYLFVPEISDLCETYHCKYIGWIYDSPLVSLFHRASLNPCNYLFIFDHSEYEYFSARSIPHLYYLPMAANTLRTGLIDISTEDEQRYTCDISFVGGLYETNTYNSIIGALPEDIKNEFKLYLLQNICNWSKVRPWPRVSEKTCTYMQQAFDTGKWNRMDMDPDLFLGIALLSRKLAEIDRITVLNTLADSFSVHLYTSSDSSFLQNVHVHPAVSYDTDMNKIFYLSKINLNITLPSIETGIPQRIFDIMGCGGFVLTNYQKDLEKHFTIGTDLEVFRNLDELKEKTSYYLTHEKERIKIAMNGYQKVREHFSYQHQLSQILNIIKEDMQ